jgi:hypothetical protein
MFILPPPPRGPGEPPRPKGPPPTPATRHVFAILEKNGTPSADDMAEAGAELLRIRKQGWEFELEKIAYQGDVYRHMEEMVHYWTRIQRVNAELQRRAQRIKDEVMAHEERKRRRAILEARAGWVRRIQRRAPIGEANRLALALFKAFRAGMILRRIARSLTPR